MDITYRNKSSILVRVVLISFLICVLLSGCDRYAGRRPYDYGTADWVCEDPGIILHILPDGSLKLEVLDRDLDDSVYPDFSPGTEFLILDRQEEAGTVFLFRGNCRFGSKQMKVFVTIDDLFDGQYLGKTIVFTRYEITAE